MRRLLALGISIGVLAGLFTWASYSLPTFPTAAGAAALLVPVWVGFAAWALFYAAGAGTGGLVKTLASTASGVVWGWLIVKATTAGGGSAAVLGLCVAIGAFAMCVQAAAAPLAFIPGAFVGAAAFFGNGTLFWSTLAGLVVGSLLAFASEKGADAVERLLGDRRPHQVPAETGGTA